MNYKLELRTHNSFSNISFNNILFDSFKINIIERYMGRLDSNAKLIEVIIKVRTLDDQIIKRRDGHVRIRIRGNEFTIYQQLIKILNIESLKSLRSVTRSAEQDYVYFILNLVIVNYELNSTS